MFDFDLLSERARVSPDRLAVVCVESGERLTYGELDRRVGRAADALRDHGLESGDRFGLLSFNSIGFLELFFAAGRAGLIVVPLSTRATPHELGQIARDCEMKALFYGREHEAVAAELGVELRVALGEGWTGSPPSQQMLRRGSTVAEPPAPDRTGGAADESIHCLLYTSGTTGKPKGVMIPRRQLWWNGYNTAVNWDLRADDVSPVFTPLYHAGGIAAFMIPIFTAGGTIVLHKGFDTGEVWRTIERERCTVVLGVPTIWKLMMEAPEFPTVDLSHVRWFISGGAPLPRYLIDAYHERGVPLKQGYGMTEVGVNCFTMSVSEAREKAGSIGRPMLFTDVRLFPASIATDAEELPAEVPVGEVGEMWIRGPHVSNGYWNQPEATRSAYRDDGWFRTGDLARCDEDGFYFIAGRQKDMFISGGVNVYPAEIEAELLSHPSVSDAAVVAVPDETWGEIGVAFVVGPSVGAEALVEYLEPRLARFKIPSRFVFVDALPRTPYGKVVKADLAALIAAGPEERV